MYPDHYNLQYIFKKKELNLRQHRWRELLKDHDMTILYHPGMSNIVTDVLSRKVVSMGNLELLNIEE